MSQSNRKESSSEIQALWGDYNARGWSGEEDDDCIYSLHRNTLEQLVPYDGKRVFVYDDDINENGEPEVFGYIFRLEKVAGYSSEWRAKPIHDSWYRGPKEQIFKNDT